MVVMSPRYLGQVGGSVLDFGETNEVSVPTRNEVIV